MAGFSWISELLTDTPTHKPPHGGPDVNGLIELQEDPGLTPGGLEPTNNVPTLGKMQLGSFVHKWVVAIEGVQYLLSDAPSASVLSAWAAASGGDWTSVLPGLFVELRNTQSISPDDPMPNAGRCRISVLDTDHTDTFGILVNKRAAGDKTTLTETADRNDTTLNVASTTGFAASGTVYVGSEAVGYTGVTATSFTGCTRGKWSPFATGATGTRFPNHHRVTTDVGHILSNPVVSEFPRVWIGKRVGVWLHTWNEETQQLNTQANAQLVFAGRIAGIADDPDSMCTVLDIEHEATVSFRNGVIGQDLLAADIAPGINLVEGRQFQFQEFIVDGSPLVVSADNLVVVASGASGAYEINAGYYNGDEICAAISGWLGAALAATDIEGFYSWSYGVTSNVGLRTKCYWKVENASDITCMWAIAMPGEVAAFLGLRISESDETGQSVWISTQGASNENQIFQGDGVPMSTMIFKPLGPSRIGQEFEDSAIVYELENERGEFVDQFASLPAAIKGASSTGAGIFLLDEKVTVVATYDDATRTIKNCWLAPFQLIADNGADALSYIGRRLDEPAGPVTIRQVLVIEGKLSEILNQMVYSSGVAGLNHATADTLGYSLGLGIPGELLGEEWDRSIAALSGAQSPIALVLEEPTKFSELFRDDLRLRRAFVRWKDEGFEFSTWRTPLVSVATATLAESNKALPAGDGGNHRIASEETSEWHFPVVKVDYSRDFGSGRNDQYLKSFQLEDQSAVDSAGSAGRSLTLKMRNTYAQFSNTGAAIEEIIKEYLPGMPMFSRPARKIARSMDCRYFETLGPGDIVVVEDEFARDPLTGARGISARAGIVTRTSYDIGGPVPDGSVRPMTGSVEVFFLDTQRGGVYGPGAEIDHEANFGGFSAGYKSATNTIRTHKEKYGITITINTKRGPVTHTIGLDASWFVAGDKITIVEMDPADTAAPVTWDRVISSVSGLDITLTAALSSPAWDATKRYRIMYDKYSDTTSTQKDNVFQADEADEMIEDADVADHYSAAKVDLSFLPTSLADKAELIADQTYGDGKSMDVGTDAAMGYTANAYIDYKSAHQAPYLHETPFALYDEVTVKWFTMAFWPIFLGTDHLPTTIAKSLTVAPFFRSQAGGTAKVRITIMSQPPIASLDTGFLPGEQYRDVVIVDRSSQSGEYTTTSTTWQTGDDTVLSLNCKDMFFGFVWVLIEGQGDVECRGLAKCIEGPRTVAT